LPRSFRFPETFKRTLQIIKIIRAQSLAQRCWKVPEESKIELTRESDPITAVAMNTSGTVTQIERA
jgi:hypothetical protein